MALSVISKPDRLSCLGPVDTQSLDGVLNSLSNQLWQIEDATKENAFPCFHDTQHMVLRFIVGDSDAREILVKPGWLLFQSALEPTMRSIARGYGFEEPAFPKAMFARLKAGEGIDSHVDRQKTNRHVHKIHVPLQTNAQTFMTIAGERFHLERGQAYEVNNLVPHAVENGGEEDRIHFIFEVFEGKGQEIHYHMPHARPAHAAA